MGQVCQVEISRHHPGKGQENSLHGLGRLEIPQIVDLGCFGLVLLQVLCQ